MPDANVLLREDHRKVKELFRKFESTEDTQEKKAIADAAILELDIHARLEKRSSTRLSGRCRTAWKRS